MKITALIVLAVVTLVTATSRAEPQAVNVTDPPGASPTGQPTADIKAMLTRMRRCLEDFRLIDPPGDNASELLTVLRQQAPDHPEVRQIGRELYEELLRVSKKAIRASAFDRASQLLQGARAVGADDSDPALAEVEIELARERKKYPDPYIIN